MKQNFTNIKRSKLFKLHTLWLVCLFFLLLSNVAKAQSAEPYNWGNVAIGGGGFVSGIITSKTQPGLIYARTDVGGAYRWDATNSKWIPLVDFASESFQGLFGVESLAIDPQKPNILYISTGISYFNSGKSYILRSTDYGATFTIVEVTSQFKINGNGMARQEGEKLQVDPNNSNILYCGTRFNGIFKSTNSGSTWSNLPFLNVTTTANGNGVSFVVLDKSSVAGGVTQRIFAGISRTGNANNLYKSEDGGASFTPLINAAIPDAYMPQRAVLSGDNAYLYITYANGGGPYGTTAEPVNQGQIWKYTIADGTWTNITPLTSANRVSKAYCGISVDPNNPNRLVASTTNNYNLQYGSTYGDKIYYSTDGGINWIDVVSRGFTLDANGVTWVPGQSIHWAGSIEFDPSNTNRVYIVSGNGVFVNNDITAAAGVWKFTVKGLEETVAQNLVSIKGGPFLTVISDYDGFRHTDATQYAPIYNPRMGSTSGLDYAINNNSKVVRVGASMYYSTDQAVTWTVTKSLKGASGQVALSTDGNVILHCPSGSTITYRSTDNGTTWTNVTGLTTNVRPISDGVNASKFYAYNNSNGAFMVSTDGGSSFTAAPNATNRSGSNVVRNIPGREGTVWIALYGSGLVYTEDAGATPFKKISGVTYCEAVGIGKAFVAGGYETIYIWGTIGGLNGLFRSTDKGASWIRVNDDAHQYGGPANGQFVQGDLNIFGRVYLSTAGRGIVYGSAIPALTASSSNLIYASDASAQTVNITSNQNWTATTNQNWITLSSASGYNNGVLTINVAANTASASRSGTVTITGGGITQTISITQKSTALGNIGATAQAAYALRQLKNNYTHSAITAPTAVSGLANSATPVVRVRRSSDNALLDVGYTTTGDLDTATLKSFTGSGNAYVTIWYDQSGSSKDAVQTSESAQPRLVNAGVIDRDGTWPALVYSGSQWLNTPLGLTRSTVPAATVNMVYRATNITTGNGALWGTDNGNWDRFQLLNFDREIGFGTSNGTTALTQNTLNTLNKLVYTSVMQNNVNNGSVIYTNGIVGTPYTETTGDDAGNIQIGAIGNGYPGYINSHEFVCFYSALTDTDRQTLESNQAAYYNPAPFIASFSPSSAAAGATVTIAGSGFANITAVKFGGVSASFNVLSPTSITAVVPSSGATGAVSVTNSGGSGSKDGFTFLSSFLDKLNVSIPAQGAFSLRQLKNNYTHLAITPPAAVSGLSNSATPVVRVRRSSDNALLDVGYNTTGDLDTATLKSFAGTGNAYVTIWYDQSGNSKDAIQTVEAAQPRLVNAGVIDRDGTLPAMVYSGSQWFNTTLGLTRSVVPAATVNMVYRATNITTGNGALWGTDNGNWDRFQLLYFNQVPNIRFGMGNGNTAVPQNALITMDKLVYTSVMQNNVNNGSVVYTNGIAGTPYTETTGDDAANIQIGAIGNGYAGYINGQEFICFYSAIGDADRQNLESNQKTYYFPANVQANSLAVILAQPTLVSNAVTGNSSGLVKLEWKARNETIGSLYQIQKLHNTVFSSIGSLTGNGKGVYSTNDSDPNNGDNFYRIMATNVDGKQIFSETVKVSMNSGERSIHVYPNPIQNQQIVLNFKNMPQGQYQVSIVNAIGNIVKKLAIGFDGSSASVNIPAAGYRGVYLIHISSGKYNQTEKIVINQ